MHSYFLRIRMLLNTAYTICGIQKLLSTQSTWGIAVTCVKMQKEVNRLNLSPSRMTLALKIK